MGFKEDGAQFVEGVSFRDPGLSFAVGEVTRFVNKAGNDEEDDDQEFHYEHDKRERLPQSMEFLKKDIPYSDKRRGTDHKDREHGHGRHGYGSGRESGRQKRGRGGYQRPAQKQDKIKKQVKSLVLRKPAPLILPGKKAGASQSSAVSTGASSGSVPGMGANNGSTAGGSFSGSNEGSSADYARSSGYDPAGEEEASSMDRPQMSVKTIRKMDPARSGTAEPTKKPISRETRLAANKAAISNMLRAKAEIERGIGSDRSTGDALADGNSGVVRVITEMLNPVSHIKSIIHTLAGLMLPHLITIFLFMAFIMVLITMVISALTSMAGIPA